MRETEARFWMLTDSSLRRVFRITAITLGVGLVMAAGPVRAGDDGDDDDKSFEEKIVEGLMRGIGGTNMENRGIEYRERSPLVVPPKLDLPPPANSAEVKAPNWPKDPDEKRRKAAALARKKENKDPTYSSRLLTSDELNAGKTARPVRTNNDPVQPGVTTNPILSPSQLGYEGGLMGMFKGNTAEATEFKGEPPRESLVEPPPGYQTPSSNYVYGTGPRESLNKNYDVMTGKER